MDFSNFSTTTDRLIIRSFTEKDADDIFIIKTEDNFTKYLPDDPWKSINDAKEFLEFAIWLYTDDISRNWFRIFFAICDKQTNKLIGYCGFGNTEYLPKSVEIFYGISKNHKNNGYAYEACMKMIQVANRSMNINEFIGFVHNQNEASKKVLEKAGFQYKKIINDAPVEHEKYNGQMFYTKIV